SVSISDLFRFSSFGFPISCEQLLSLIVICLLFTATTGPAATSSAPTLSDLKAYPPEINLSAAKAHQRVVVQATYSDGQTRDVTTEASYKLADAKLAKAEKSILSPAADGKTELRVTFKDRSLKIPLCVTNSKAQPPLSFK